MIPFLKEVEDDVPKSLINQIFSNELLKKICYHCCRLDIDDNNEKADLLQELLGDEFIELGSGTNRVAYMYNPSQTREFKGGAGLVYIVALDRRGMIDNLTEFKRSAELEHCGIKGYECNMLILVEECVTLMEKREFRINEDQIKTILAELSKGYLFEDIGFSEKNYANWGYRQNGDIVILDLGYVYPLGPQNRHVMECPRCQAQLVYNHNYTGFVCTNSDCRTNFKFMDLRNRMNRAMEDFENQMIMELEDFELPDFEQMFDDIGIIQDGDDLDTIIIPNQLLNTPLED